MQYQDQSYSSRRSIRLRGYDYRQSGAYFDTICANRKTKLFGTICEGEMVLNDLGKVANEEWQHLAKARTNVQLDLFVVMLNHLHGVIIIDDTRRCDAFGGVPAAKVKSSGTLPAGSLGAIIGQFKAAVTRRAKFPQLYCDQRIWQRNYHEHIIRDEKSLNEIRRYIIENPARWNDDSMYVE